MRYIVVILFIFSIANADLGNQVSKSKSNQDTQRDSKQVSKQKSKTESKTLGKGSEKSNTKTISRTLSKLNSVNHTASRSINGSWSITLNPIPYILNELRDMGWNRKSFFLRQKDIGSLDYVVDEDEEFGELQNIDKYQAIQNRASKRGKLTALQTKKLQRYITLLYYTAGVIEKATKLLQDFPSLHVGDFERNVKRAVLRAYKQTRVNPISFRDCYFGGDVNSYSCGYGKYTLVLTNSLPNLYINGAPYYTATSVGFTNPSLNISFATSTSEAFSNITQNQQSSSIAGMIRDYTNKLEQKGESEVATKIRNKFVEKTLSNSLSTSATTVVQAINSGSPLAVLKIFQ